jgi:hypothetical protein
MRRRKRLAGRYDLISASEIACFAYCREQWRLQYGQGIEPEYREALAAGERHHAHKAVAERVAGGSMALGRVLLFLAVMALARVLSR